MVQMDLFEKVHDHEFLKILLSYRKKLALGIRYISAYLAFTENYNQL
jgi:hypothetical protein